jgi:hypothetical protein
MLEETDRQVDNARTRVTRHRLAPGAHTGPIVTSTTTSSFR